VIYLAASYSLSVFAAMRVTCLVSHAGESLSIAAAQLNNSAKAQSPLIRCSADLSSWQVKGPTIA